jgi:hypothetical protein
LIVSYATSVFDDEQVRRRIPVLRHVYNVLPEARDAVDRVAATLSQTMHSRGGGTHEIGAYVRRLLDVGAHRTFLAHVARDAFACGNGYLSFGSVPDEDLRLLPPEHTWMIGPDRAVVVEDGEEVVHESVMHLRGAQQVDSQHGVSVLEPFVMLAMRRRLFEGVLADEAAFAAAGRAAAAARMAPRGELARRVLAEDRKTATTLLGGAATLPADVPRDLYFPGHELMQPAVDALAFLDPDPA